MASQATLYSSSPPPLGRLEHSELPPGLGRTLTFPGPYQKWLSLAEGPSVERRVIYPGNHWDLDSKTMVEVQAIQGRTDVVWPGSPLAAATGDFALALDLPLQLAGEAGQLLRLPWLGLGSDRLKGAEPSRLWSPPAAQICAPAPLLKSLSGQTSLLATQLRGCGWWSDTSIPPACPTQPSSSLSISGGGSQHLRRHQRELCFGSFWHPPVPGFPLH